MIATPPVQPRFTRWLLSLLSFALASTAIARDTASEKAVAETYRAYLNLSRAKIDAKFHPEPARQATAEKSISSLTAKVGSQDPEKLQLELKSAGTQRLHIIRLLAARESSYQKKILATKTEIKTLTKQETENDAAHKKNQESIATLEEKLTWLEKHASFNTSEKIALVGKPSPERQLLQLYEKLIALKEMKIDVAHTANPARRATSEATVELLSQELTGQTLAATRDQLPSRQLSFSQRTIEEKSRANYRQIKRTRATNTTEMARLQALRSLYQAELKKLKALRSR